MSSLILRIAVLKENVDKTINLNKVHIMINIVISLLCQPFANNTRRGRPSMQIVEGQNVKIHIDRLRFEGLVAMNICMQYYFYVYLYQRQSIWRRRFVS